MKNGYFPENGSASAGFLYQFLRLVFLCLPLCALILLLQPAPAPMPLSTASNRAEPFKKNPDIAAALRQIMAADEIAQNLKVQSLTPLPNNELEILAHANEAALWPFLLALEKANPPLQIKNLTLHREGAEINLRLMLSFLHANSEENAAWRAALQGIEHNNIARLFSPLRTAPPSATPSNNAETEPLLLGRYKILGLITIGGQGKLRLEAIESAQKSTWQVGDKLDGWEIVGLTANRLDLKRGVETRSITLP